MFDQSVNLFLHSNRQSIKNYRDEKAKDKSSGLSGLERSLHCKAHWAVLQKSQVRFLAPNGVSQTSVTSVSGESKSSFGFQVQCTHVLDIQTFIKNKKEKYIKIIHKILDSQHQCSVEWYERYASKNHNSDLGI